MKLLYLTAPPPWQRTKGIPDCEKHVVQAPSGGRLFPPTFHMVRVELVGVVWLAKTIFIKFSQNLCKIVTTCLSPDY